MCEDKKETIKPKWANDLKNSPIFNMSLSGKELFHSNFIAWILDKYKCQMGEIISEKLGITPSLEISCVDREKKNIDISFKIGDTSIFIENKVKSIAYEEQLDKYAGHEEIQKAINAKCIILSLKEPTFLVKNLCYVSEKEDIVTAYEKLHKDNSEEKLEKKLKQKIKNITWEYISYENFIKDYLEALVKKNPETDKYHTDLIKDYIKFINILVNNILGLIKNAQITNLHKKGTNENDALEVLTMLKMHDFYQKGIFEEFKIKVEKEFDRSSLNIENFVVDSYYSSNKGGFDIKYKKDDFYYGIQIEGNQYRQFMKGDDGKKVLEVGTSIFKKEWFCFNNYDGEKTNREIENRPRTLEGFTNTKNFCQYSKFTFIYKYVMLDKLNCTNDIDLISIIIKDMKKAVNMGIN